MHPILIKNLAGLLHDQKIANTPLVRCWKTNAHWQTSDSLARKFSEAKMMGIVLVNYMRCAAISIWAYEVEHVCICPGFSRLPGWWYLCVVMALVHQSRISFTSACLCVYMCCHIYFQLHSCGANAGLCQLVCICVFLSLCMCVP